MNEASGLVDTQWPLEPVSDAFEFTRKPRGRAPQGQTIPFYPMDRIPQGGKIRVRDWENRPVEKLGSGTYVEKGDLMVAKITPSFENGKQAIADLDEEFGYATTEVIPLRGIPGKGWTEYLHFILFHPELRTGLAGKMEGSTGRQRLSKGVLSETPIPLPPLPEQKKIAHILSTVQRAIEEQEKIIQTTTELKKALMPKQGSFHRRFFSLGHYLASIF